MKVETKNSGAVESKINLIDKTFQELIDIAESARNNSEVDQKGLIKVIKSLNRVHAQFGVISKM